MDIPDLADPRPPYLQISDDLRRRIDSGEVQPGERLPSHKALAGRYRTTATTVSKALGVLADEGLVRAHSTLGTYVMRSAPEAGPAAGDALRRDVDALQVDVMELYTKFGFEQPSHQQDRRQAKHEHTG